MISRREVVTAGMLGTLATASPSEVRELQEDVQALKAGFKAVADTLEEIKTSVDRGLRGSSLDYGYIGGVTGTIQKYARLSGKFPEFCEIGIAVFYEIYDWHVRHNQQIAITRINDNRLMINFMFTQFILRWEQEPGYIGPPY